MRMVRPEEIFFSMDTINTRRLILRKLTMRDANDMFIYSRNPEVARHVLWDAHLTPGNSKSYIRHILRKYRAGEPASWGIEHREHRRLIGTIGYMWYQPDNNAAELGYSLNQLYWNRGYMTEALSAVIAHSFNVLFINRLEAQHEITNPASGAVMRKAGMTLEGTLRQRLFNKGRYVDVALYAILMSDYASKAQR